MILAQSHPLQIGFIIEHELGHVTHAQNLQYAASLDPDVEAEWLFVQYHTRDIWETARVPFSIKLSLRARTKVRQRLRQEPLNCLYFHTQALTLLSLAEIKRTPTVISLDATPRNFNTVASAYNAQCATGVFGQIKTAWFRKIFLHAAGFVAFSNWVKESLIEDYGVPPNKVAVIHSGVRIDEWRPQVKMPARGRKLRLLFVGGDFCRKGGDVLLTAFQSGLKSFCEMDIVTKDPTIMESDGIRVHHDLCPNDPRLKQLFLQSDIFVLPTQGDATPFSILEAMACGLPIITTNVGALGELVQDGINGYLIPLNDPGSIIACVESLSNDPEKLARMGDASRSMIEQDYDAEVNYKRLMSYLKDVAQSQT